ncbi:MAG: tripartite tricarboxylate transporter substrate binding protein [Burkholderiales bacterium]|nr:tripartite tricarboxylate transporter substrate binding protein [Burkholderiales bacterium]
MTPRLRWLSCAMPAMLFAVAGSAAAQNYPQRPVRIIIPFAAGGATDVVFRMLAPRLSEELGQQVLIDNRPGGGATIGMDLVAKSAPDGYTLGVANVSLGVNPFVLSRLPYDTVKDFAPVSLVATVTQVLLVHPSLPVKSVKALVALARSRPGELNYASGGNASSGHLACELLMYRTGVRMVHIPYKGGGPSVASTISGETAINFTSVPASVNHLKAGRLVGLGVSTRTRDPALPEVPSIAESGVPGYEFFDWQGVVAPATTPAAAIGRLHAEIVKVLADPGLRSRITGVGAQAVGGTPRELGAFIRKELETWSVVVKAAGIRTD